MTNGVLEDGLRWSSALVVRTRWKVLGTCLVSVFCNLLKWKWLAVGWWRSGGSERW